METSQDTPPSTGDRPAKDDRTWGMFTHLSALAGLVIPFGSILGPLIVWLVKKEEMPFVNDQGKEALNFNITVALAGIVSAVLTLILIGFLLLLAVFIYWIVMTIIAGMKANEGEAYRYPITLRLIT